MSRIGTALARLLAVLALAAVAVAIFFVVSAGVKDEDKGDGKSTVAPNQREIGNGDRQRNRNQGGPPKVYIVQPGDTLTGIAVETGVSIERIQQLNPGLDPQILNSGQRLRLR